MLSESDRMTEMPVLKYSRRFGRAATSLKKASAKGRGRIQIRSLFFLCAGAASASRSRWNSVRKNWSI